MSIHGLLFQWASTMTIQLCALAWYKVDLIIISLKINLFSSWYSWKIARLPLSSKHSLYNLSKFLRSNCHRIMVWKHVDTARYRNKSTTRYRNKSTARYRNKFTARYRNKSTAHYRNKFLGASKPKGLSRTAKIGYQGHLCLKEVKICLFNNYII